MKTLSAQLLSVLVLVTALALPSLASAESFTLTRGTDGKVFYCTDQGVGPIPTAQMTVCDCIDSVYNTNYGQVVGAAGSNLTTACRQQSSNGILKNCATRAGSSVTCDCIDSVYNTNYGQVLGTTGTDARDTCRQNSSNGILKNCQVE